MQFQSTSAPWLPDGITVSALCLRNASVLGTHTCQSDQAGQAGLETPNTQNQEKLVSDSLRYVRRLEIRRTKCTADSQQCSSGVGWRTRLAVSLGILLSASIAIPAGAQTQCDYSALNDVLMGDWLNNVAIVRSEKAQREGVGLVVGWNSTQTWIAVPAHVVFGQDILAPDLAHYQRGLRVSIAGKHMTLCGPPRDKAGVYDLSFLCVQSQNFTAYSTGLPAKEVTKGDAARLLGIADKASLLATSGVVDPSLGSTAERERGEIVVAGLKGLPTQSGSPVATQRGVAGLYLGTYGDSDGRMLSLESIRTRAREAGIPWSLLQRDYFDCQSKRRLCPKMERAPAPENLTLVDSATRREITIPVGQCEDLVSARYAVKPNKDFVCEPTSIGILPGAEPLHIGFNCMVNLSGIWASSSGSQLGCFEGGINTYHCNGLMDLGMGTFTAVLQPLSDTFPLQGASFVTAFGQTLPATGTLRWIEGRLVMDVARQGLPLIHLELQRIQ